MADATTLGSAALADRMLRLGLDESDIDEQFVRSGGPGGQHVNKVSTCVILRHGPTGTAVRCEQSRSLVRNRLAAREQLCDTIERQRAEARARRKREAALRRRLNRRPSRRERQRKMESKKQRAEKKKLRQKPGTGE